MLPFLVLLWLLREVGDAQEYDDAIKKAQSGINKIERRAKCVRFGIIPRMFEQIMMANDAMGY